MRESTLHSAERTVRLIGGSSTGLNRRIILAISKRVVVLESILGVDLFVRRIVLMVGLNGRGGGGEGGGRMILDDIFVKERFGAI